MKRPVIIGLLLLLDLAAYNQAKVLEPVKGPTYQLQSIDSLMWQRPDSALALLLPWFDTVHANETFNNHYAHLLLSELLYKNDYAQTNREELQRAVAYFDSLALTADTRDVAFWDARAHYINGVGYYEQDSVVEACKEYIKALGTMEKCFDEKDLVGDKARFMALTYTHLTGLFSDQYLHEQAIYFGNRALDYYQRYDATSWHKAWMLYEIGSQYEMKSVFDSAVYYYQKGVEILPDTNNLSYRDINSRLAFLSYVQEGNSTFSLMRLKTLLGQAESEKELFSRCLPIGEIYYHEKQYDSALVYLGKVYHDSQSVGAKRQAAEWLVEICTVQGKNFEASEYARFLVPFANMNENQSQLKSQLTNSFQEYKQESFEFKHRKQLQRLGKYGVVALMILAILAIGILVFHLVQGKQHKCLRLQKEAVEEQLKTERYAHEMKQKALSGRLKESNNALRVTKKRLEKSEAKRVVIGKDCSKSFGKEQYEAFLNAPVCLSLLKTIDNLRSDNRNVIKTNVDITEYKGFAMSVSQTVQLISAVETAFPHLQELLKTQYPSLDRNEWVHCCLYLLQLEKMSVCILLQEPYYTCRRCTMKLEEAFGCKRALSSFLIEQAICQRY